MTSDRILVAVFDSAHVRFFEYKEPHAKLEAVLGEVSSKLHHDHRDIDSDRPGRGFGGGGQHHAYESPSDPRKLEKHDFVRAIAQAIEAALDAHAFGRLAIVAPARSVGEFRSVASPKVRKVLWREVPKELSNLTDAQLREHLIPELRKLAA
ncbi:MAG TPA: host attachment protein [Rhizomicrobium sp.]|jgi:protein required for attachment to host cells|nr:host attachment protein [Rhizomicrobium sp.]